MKDLTDESGSSGTETPTNTTEVAQQWVINTCREKAQRAKKDYRARSGQHHIFQLSSVEERDRVVHELRQDVWRPTEAKGHAFVGYIETDDLGGLLLFVATKADMVSPKEMSRLRERVQNMPKNSHAPRYTTPVIESYRKPRPTGHIVMPDGTIGARANISDGNEMGADLLRLVDEA